MKGIIVLREAADGWTGEPLTTRSAGNFVRGEVGRNKRSPQCGAAPIEDAEYTRVYPVYTWHADEVLAVSRYVADKMKKREQAGLLETEEYFWMFDLQCRLDRLYQTIRAADGAIVYLDRDDRKLVEQVYHWCQDLLKKASA